MQDNTLLPNITTSDIMQCFQNMVPKKKLTKETINYLLTTRTPQEILLGLVEVLNTKDGGYKIFHVAGKDIPVAAFVLKSWSINRGYEFTADDVDVYASAYLCRIIDDLDVHPNALGHAVSDGYIDERKTVHGEV